MDIDTEKLATLARESLSTYCFTECKAHCCRHGFLLLTSNEVGLFKDTAKEDLKVIPIQEDKKEFILNLSEKTSGCPNLKDYKCTIHKNPLRPTTCSNYPLFIRKDKTILIASSCQGVKENMLYPYLAEFKRSGHKLVYTKEK